MQKLTLKLLFLGIVGVLCNSASAVQIPEPSHPDDKKDHQATNPQPPVQLPVQKPATTK